MLAGEGKQTAGIARRRVDADVPRDRRDSRDGEFGRGQREEDADGVVDAGIRIDDDVPGFYVRHDGARNLAVSPFGCLSDTGPNLTIATGAP